MKKYLVDNNSDTLLIFFTGWGCDETEFEHLVSNYDILLLYNYTDLNLDFDFSKYKNFYIIAFSAGVFVSSIFKFNFKWNKAIAISGNPYLFNEELGLSSKIQNILYNITEKSADEFAKNYLIKTEEEYRKFHHSNRTIDSCKKEFNCLKKIYQKRKQDIKDIFDKALIGEEDPIFNVSAQKKFYGKRLNINKNSRHNLFFQITKYEQILELIQ